MRFYSFTYKLSTPHTKGWTQRRLQNTRSTKSSYSTWSHEPLQRQPEGNQAVGHTWLCWLVIGVSDKQRSSIQSNREAEILLQYQVLHDGFGLRLSCWWVPGVIAYKSEQQIKKGTKNSFLCCLRGHPLCLKLGLLYVLKRICLISADSPDWSSKASSPHYLWGEFICKAKHSFPKLFPFVLQRIFCVCLLTTMSQKWHFLKEGVGMIPAKLGQRTLPSQEWWADTVLWIQLHGNQKSMKKGDWFWGAWTESIFSEMKEIH